MLHYNLNLGRAALIGACADLYEQYEVRLEEGLDAFVVLDGLPIVPAESKEKLVKYITKKLNTAGRIKEEAFFMPTDDKDMTQG